MFLRLQIAGVDYLYFIQNNTLNRRDRTLHIEVRNETFSNRVIVRECCNYTVSVSVEEDNQLIRRSWLGGAERFIPRYLHCREPSFVMMDFVRYNGNK